MDAETLYDSLITVAGRLDSTAFRTPSDIDITPRQGSRGEAGRRRLPPQYLRASPPADASLPDGRLRPAADDAELHGAPPLECRHAGAAHDERLHVLGTRPLYGGPRDRRSRSRPRAGRSKPIYLRALSRRPTPAEPETRWHRPPSRSFGSSGPRAWPPTTPSAALGQLLQWLAVANYCHAILNSAEFSFID